MTTNNNIAADSRSLDALRVQAGKDPQKALQAAAKQFETVFMNMLLKSMRDTVPKDGMFDNSESRTYQGMLDQQLAQGLSGNGTPGSKGTGLAELIVKQLSRNLQSVPAETVAPQAPATGSGVSNNDATSVSSLRLQAMRAATRAAETDSAQAAQGKPVAGDTPRSFIARMWNEARTAEAQTGVPAQFMVGQAALESGWGQHEIRGMDGAASHNLFGIKAGAGWSGKSVQALTTEYVNGKAVKKVENFRAYDSYAEAFADYSRMVSQAPRYSSARQQSSANGYAKALQTGGYATDPQYAEKLTRTINQTIALARTA
jgi:flagellar protein FlgJ